jgi:hypothetical protein
VFLSIDHQCNCTRALSFYCLILSTRILAGGRKSASVGNLLLETQRALKINRCAETVARA